MRYWNVFFYKWRSHTDNKTLILPYTRVSVNAKKLTKGAWHERYFVLYAIRHFKCIRIPRKSSLKSYRINVLRRILVFHSFLANVLCLYSAKLAKTLSKRPIGSKNCKHFWKSTRGTSVGKLQTSSRMLLVSECDRLSRLSNMIESFKKVSLKTRENLSFPNLFV